MEQSLYQQYKNKFNKARQAGIDKVTIKIPDGSSQQMSKSNHRTTLDISPVSDGYCCCGLPAPCNVCCV